MNTSPDTEFDRASRQRGIRNTVLVLLLIVAAVIGLVVHKVMRSPQLDQAELRGLDAIVFDTPRRFTDIELITADEQPFTRAQLEGKWSLIFFGFTECPDICPMTLLDLQRLNANLPQDIAENVQVILVTLDPARDTPEVLRNYLAAFDSGFIGVTGEFLTIRRFANEVNVAFAKVMQGDTYTVDHSGNIVLINPKGDYHGFFKPPFDVAKLERAFTSIYRSFSY